MATYGIRALGDPPAGPVSGSETSEALDLNNSGMVVGVAGIPGYRALFWNPGPTLLSLGDGTSVPYGVNDFGDVVGSRESPEGSLVRVFPGEAFVVRGGVVHILASVLPGPSAVAVDINNAGVLAAWSGEFGQVRAFACDTNTDAVTDLGILPGFSESFAHAINNRGQIVGVSRTSVASNAFLFDGTLHDLGPATSANDINDAGVVVGARVVGGASFWTAYRCDTSTGTPQFVDLGTLPGCAGSEARGINRDGDIVGHAFTAPSDAQRIHAFVCPAHGPMQDLNELIPAGSGWDLTWANAINDKGQIAGTGTFKGRRQAYLLTPASRYTAQVAIDPMALILATKWYLIWVDLHHPNVPRIADLNVVLRLMPPEERQATLERLRRLGAFGELVATTIGTMIDVK